MTNSPHSMSSPQDYLPTLGDFDDALPQRWLTIRRFIERWHGIPLPAPGGQQERIAEIERKLGYALPSSVHEWISLLHDLLDSNGYDRVFRDCLSFEEVPGHPAVSLLIQGEADYHWAVKKEHLGEDDPPVDGYRLDYETDAPTFVPDQPWSPRVSDWALGFILSYLNTSAPSAFGGEVDDAEALTDQLRLSFPVHLDLGRTQIFETTNLIALITRDWFGHGVSLNVYAWKQIPKADIPACIWASAAKGGWFGGMFM